MRAFWALLIVMPGLCLGQKTSGAPSVRQMPGIRFEVDEYIVPSSGTIPPKPTAPKSTNLTGFSWPQNGQRYTWEGQMWHEYFQFSAELQAGMYQVDWWTGPQTRYEVNDLGNHREIKEVANLSRTIEPHLGRIFYDLKSNTSKTPTGSFRHKKLGKINVVGLGDQRADGSYQAIEWIAVEKGNMNVWSGTPLKPSSELPYVQDRRAAGLYVEEVGNFGGTYLPVRTIEYGVGYGKLSRISEAEYVLDNRLSASSFVPPKVEGDIWVQAGWNYVVRGGKLSILTYQPNHPVAFFSAAFFGLLLLIYLGTSAFKLVTKSNGAIFDQASGTKRL